MRKLLIAAALLLPPLVPLASASEAGAAQPRIHTVVMANMRFGPIPAGIKAGDVIVWVNRDVVPHTATSREGGFDVDLPARQSRRMTVTRAGTFAFFCRYHPGMRGTLTAGR
ncbi:MAG TPA: cupredoxin domain-containing protein [Allosphingosinicella sp.]|nr:cupredoxin domain-containing protein [Allosphingosinicella sp.]